VLQPLLQTVQLGDPGAGQLVDVAGAEEALDAQEDVGVVLVPAHPRTGRERLRQPVERAGGAGRRLEATRDVGRAVGDAEQLPLLRRQREAALPQVVDVARRGHGQQPLLHVALDEPGAVGELRRTGGALGEAVEQPEAVAQQHERDGVRRAQVADDLTEQGAEPVLVQRPRLVEVLARARHRRCSAGGRTDGL
jgi:hypothetical protein